MPEITSYLCDRTVGITPTGVEKRQCRRGAFQWSHKVAILAPGGAVTTEERRFCSLKCLLFNLHHIQIMDENEVEALVKQDEARRDADDLNVGVVANYEKA